LFIFFHGNENEPKETALAPLASARRESGRSASEPASLKQADALFPYVRPMLDAGQRDETHVVSEVSVRNHSTP
jgi:hypothetical protein